MNISLFLFTLDISIYFLWIFYEFHANVRIGNWFKYTLMLCKSFRAFRSLNLLIDFQTLKLFWIAKQFLKNALQLSADPVEMIE